MKRFLVAAAMLASCLAIPARADAATPDAEAAATALVEQAARAYDQNQLDEALRLLARAYEMSPRPSILYNQAQVLRTKDDCAGALDAYQRFIATTTATDRNRERALHHRAEMQACVDRRGGAPGATSPPGDVAATPGTKPEASSPEPSAVAPAPPEQTPPAAPAPPQLTLNDRAAAAQPPPGAASAQIATAATEDAGRSRRRAMRITGWALVGAGVVAAGAAAALAWEAHHIQDELTSATTYDPVRNPAREAEGRRDATWARLCGAAAAVAGGGGAALLVLSRPAAAPGDAPGNASSRGVAALIGWSGTF